MALISTIQNLNKTNGFEDALHARDITSEQMKSAVTRWFNLYYGMSLGGGYNAAQRIPYTIVDGVHKAAFGEYRATMSSDTAKDKLLAVALENLNNKADAMYQSALIGGEGFIKPVVKGDNFTFTFINRLGYIVLGRDPDGEINDVGTAQQTIRNTKSGKAYYTLVERRTVNENGYLTIRNMLYQSETGDTLGSPVLLSALPEYEALEPEMVLPIPLENLGLIPIKMPMTNCIDGSEDGVSIYAAAADKVMQQYHHEQRIQDEYDVTVPALYMSEDEYETDEYGRPIIPKYAHAIDDSPANVGRFVYNPTPNQEELEARANQNLRDIENIIGLRRGFLSNVDSEERTATEIISSTAKFAQNIALLQEVWQDAVLETLRTCDLLGQMYLGWGKEKYTEPTIDWGNGVLYDEQQDYERNLRFTENGWQKPEIIVGWQHGMPTETEEEQAKVREKYMPEAQTQTFGGFSYPPGEDGM